MYDFVTFYLDLKQFNQSCAFTFDFSGLGYIIGSSVAQLFGSWQWALRVSHVTSVAVCDGGGG